MKRIYPLLLVLIISVISFNAGKNYSSTAFQSRQMINLRPLPLPYREISWMRMINLLKAL